MEKVVVPMTVERLESDGGRSMVRAHLVSANESRLEMILGRGDAPRIGDIWHVTVEQSPP